MYIIASILYGCLALIYLGLAFQASKIKNNRKVVILNLIVFFLWLLSACCSSVFTW